MIGDKLRIEGLGPEIEIFTDEQLRMSVAVLAGERIPITEAEADALTVIGAVDSRRHLKSSAPGSVILGLQGSSRSSDMVFIALPEPVL